MNSMLEEQPPQQKLAMCLLASGLVTGGAALVCVLCGLDPLGGASLSLASLQAAAVGGAAAAPLVGLKALLWSETARRELPFLEDIHKSQVWVWVWCVVVSNSMCWFLFQSSGSRGTATSCKQLAGPGCGAGAARGRGRGAPLQVRRRLVVAASLHPPSLHPPSLLCTG